MTQLFGLVLALLVGALLARRASVFSVALIAPILGLLGYLVFGGIWSGVAVFVALNVGYVAAVAWAAASQRRVRRQVIEPTLPEPQPQPERAQAPVKSLLP